jgi:flagellar biosynthetic protein FliR
MLPANFAQYGFVFLLIFARIGSAMLLLPAFSETSVPIRSRLLLTLMLCYMLLPLLSARFPLAPATPLPLFLLLASEILIGAFLGGLAQLLMSGLHMAGMMFSFQAGMSSAVIFDPAQNTQGALAGNFMSLVATVLLFTMGLDAVMLRGVAESYRLFAPGAMPPVHDMVEHTTRFLGDAFLIALQISAPFIVAGTMLFLGGGVLARLMPSFQVFFLITAPQLLINFFILCGVFSAIMLWFMHFFKDHLEMALGR